MKYIPKEGIREWYTLLHQEYGPPWNLTHTPPALPKMERCCNWGEDEDARLMGVAESGLRHDLYCHLWGHSVKSSDIFNADC